MPLLRLLKNMEKIKFLKTPPTVIEVSKRSRALIALPCARTMLDCGVYTNHRTNLPVSNMSCNSTSTNQSSTPPPFPKDGQCRQLHRAYKRALRVFYDTAMQPGLYRPGGDGSFLRLWMYVI